MFNRQEVLCGFCLFVIMNKTPSVFFAGYEKKLLISQAMERKNIGFS